MKNIYTVMAYCADKNKKYIVTNPKNSCLKSGDVISYSKTFSYDGDIDAIEVFNHRSNENVLLCFTELNVEVESCYV